MPFSIFETIFEILAQNILPLTSSPIFWTLVSFFSVMMTLRRICFPCVTLKGLEHHVNAVEEMLKEYYTEIGLVYNANEIVSGWIDFGPSPSRSLAHGLQRRLRRVKQDVHTILAEDHDSSWMPYLSTRRVNSMSSSCRKLYALQNDIKHAQTLSLGSRNSRMLELIKFISSTGEPSEV